MLRTVLIVLMLIAGPVHAAAPPAKAAPTPAGQYVEIQPVGLPIVVDGRLVNYVFVYVRLNLAPSANTARWREKEPFFRDALVRAAHRAPFTRADDYEKIDVARLTETVMREAAAITGPGVIRSAVVTGESSRYRVPMPRRAARS